jgi:alanyl-tRNA synthetase
MPEPNRSGNQIRQDFIDFFEEMGHTFVRSSSLVPGGDQTLLFTNAGMVQFKDIFLGTDKRPYSRAVNSQKCMRVAGKHNDLEDVGQDDTHHTFFEMLGNWSFGDYYKKEAIEWAWELFTRVWDLPKDRLWASCFEDELGEIPRDDEAADEWRKQPGFNPAQVLFFGRKDNFWEMAETGPCGPNSEIHLDQGEKYCDKQDIPGHECRVNGDCQRFLELWNLVFIQYNRLDPKTLEPLPEMHVDTGLGFERIVSVLQDVDSNYKTDLLSPIIDMIQQLTGDDDTARDANWTPYRVIADHGRAATFLIGDGVVPGNTGRNYVCRMIIRRAARFGGKIGLNEPFLAKIAATVIEQYGDAFPELVQNRQGIMDTITREEQRFRRTLDSGVNFLEDVLETLKRNGKTTIPGEQAFDLYATYGLPIEITRDIALEQGMEVDQVGFQNAMEQHRIDSGGDKTFKAEGESIEVFSMALNRLVESGALPANSVAYDPYDSLEVEAPVLALFSNGLEVSKVAEGDEVQILLPRTGFYLEAGGQVSDKGSIVSVQEPRWEIQVVEMRQPIVGMIVHVGVVVHGTPHAGDLAIAIVDQQRRLDIMRNHTATHLLHAELRAVLGDHVRQAGSLVAPDRLRFDFSHPEALTRQELAEIEAGVNRYILSNYRLRIAHKPLQKAIDEGAMALFGEKYAATVRTITIGDREPFSYELCGGTHMESTGDIGVFLITGESSVGSGIRRIEGVTGQKAYTLIQKNFQALARAAEAINTTVAEVPERVQGLADDLSDARKQISRLRQKLAELEFFRHLDDVPQVDGIPVLAIIIPDANEETLRLMADRFRQRYPTGVAVLASIQKDRPLLIAAVTEDLVRRGLHAGKLIKDVANIVGGGGGGRPTLAQAGGKDPEKLDQALAIVLDWVEQKLQLTG